MIERIKAKLIDDWCKAYKFASVWLAALAGVLTTLMVANPGLFIALATYLPAGWRPVGALVIGFLVAAVPTIVRLWKQK